MVEKIKLYVKKSFSLLQAEELLAALEGKLLTRKERTAKAIELTSLLLEATRHESTRSEKKRQAWLAKMMEDPKGRLFMTTATDQCFRSRCSSRTADQLLFLIKRLGIPHFLNEEDKIKFLVFKLLGSSFPGFFMPLVKKQIRKEMAAVLLPEDPKEQAAYLEKCSQEGVRVNLNHLGEAILGEKEAAKRLQIYLHDLENPAIDYVSIKISTIFSQINLIGWQKSLEILSERLRLLYRKAEAKFVNLDMEEYKDLDLTVEVFKKVLSEPEFLNYQAGIVLQSYLPDSFVIQQELTEFAQKRFKKGGAPIKIRIVKGANLAMEAVESSLRGWSQAPFSEKVESDANFKRMLEYAFLPEHARSAHIGVGSHNLFDISYALVLSREFGVQNVVDFEMLEGMAEPMRRVVRHLSKGMVLYCPEAKESDFQSAVAYLLRRLDENGEQENFLRHFFEIEPGNLAWKDQVDRFTAACEKIDSLSSKKRRHQNRFEYIPEPDSDAPFVNEADTDFSLSENRLWALSLLEEWKEKKHPDIPLVIEGRKIEASLQKGIDPSCSAKPLFSYSIADESLIDKAIHSAKAHEKSWGALSFTERSHILGKAAHLLRNRRKELIGTMVAEGGKTIWEADPEVSEAIDFIEYYRKNWEKQIAFSDIHWTSKGTFLVAPPWNFPCSIPTGGIAALLTAGNCVLFKPAPESVLTGWYLAQIFWEAGVPHEVLQFINCPDEPVGSYLIQHPDLSGVILTGGTATALKFLQLKPGLDLHAEAGGKNALIVSAMSDHDLAIKDLIQSAFGHSGQKCSACSLALLDAELYDDPHFLNQLKDAAESLPVGSAWDPFTKVTPLIHPPSGALLRGLTQLEEGESWLLKPQVHPDNPHLWSCGIKLGVKEGSFTHQTELFGPVLGLIRTTSLEEAIRLANGTRYGLTTGLHTLDEREQELWIKQIIAGNLYINRTTTGAIVRRQPFGGCKGSSFGPGAKAGGPNYVAQFLTPSQIALPSEKSPLPGSLLPLIESLKSFQLSEEQVHIWKKSAENYAYWAEILKEKTDPSCILGQDNYFYHVPLEKAVLRIQEKQELPLLQIAAACLICQIPLEISSSGPLSLMIEGISVIIESEEAFIERIQTSKVRLLGSPSKALLKKSAELGIYLQTQPVLASGRIELLHYLREVSLSVNYHRYGYLGL